MRKVLFTLLLAGALAVGITSLATGAPRCGTLYTPTCTKPHITARPPAGCKAPNSAFTLPTIRFSSNAGIRKVAVKLGSKVLRSKKFSGNGPTHYSIKGLRVHTNGLAPGSGHAITITMKDVRGKTTSRTIHFGVCHPPRPTG